MRQLRGRIRPEAVLDLSDIAIWQDQQSGGRFDRFEAAVRKALQNLIVFPEMGRAAPQVGVGRRIWRVWDYMLVYVLTDDEVIIERILHGARDLDALFDEDDDA